MTAPLEATPALQKGGGCLFSAFSSCVPLAPLAPLRSMATKTLRDRVTIALTQEDRALLEQQREALGLQGNLINDAKLILGVYRRFAGQVIKPRR